MGLIALICFFIGIISFISFVELIYRIIKRKINKSKFDYDLKFPFNYYEEKPITFLVVGLIIILMTFITMSSSILAIIFPNDLKYKPEGTYCYYVIDRNNKAYPAKVEKNIDSENDGEDYFGNSIISTSIYVEIVELYVDSKTYNFYDELPKINTKEFTKLNYYDEKDLEKEFDLKLTNDVAYCPSFGKGITKIDYFELIFEILILLSEIFMYIITIYASRREK